jgi:hypothetical protein
MPDVGFASPPWSWPTLTRPPVGLTISLWVKLDSLCNVHVAPKRLFLYVYLTFLLLSPRLLRVRLIAKALEAWVIHVGGIANAHHTTLGSRRPVVKKSLLGDDARNVH